MDSYIKREDAIKACFGGWSACHNVNCSGLEIYFDTQGILERVPAADVRPVVHARWVKKHDDVCYWWACSNCDNPAPMNNYCQDVFSAYCPNCGAMMDGEVGDGNNT